KDQPVAVKFRRAASHRGQLLLGIAFSEIHRRQRQTAEWLGSLGNYDFPNRLPNSHSVAGRQRVDVQLRLRTTWRTQPDCAVPHHEGSVARELLLRSQQLYRERQRRL